MKISVARMAPACVPVSVQLVKKARLPLRAADRLRVRQQPDGEGRAAHQEEGEDQHRLASDAVAEMAEDDRTDWARHIADAEA